MHKMCLRSSIVLPNKTSTAEREESLMMLQGVRGPPRNFSITIGRQSIDEERSLCSDEEI